MAKTKPKQGGRFAKIYREYTRVKFNKYKQQFPKIRESELIAKILKEWEAMDEEAKVNLEKKFVETSGRGFLEDPSSSDKKSKEKKEAEEKAKAEEQNPDKTKKITKKKKPSPKARVFVEKSSSDKKKTQLVSRKSSENSKSPGKKSTPEKIDTSSSQLAIKTSTRESTGLLVTKKGNLHPNPKATEYLNFFKYYHERLTAEHPRWSSAQISTIIKLLWKKRTLKGNRKTSLKSKGLTGRQLYNRAKLSEGYIKDQIKQLWRALPHESKKYWQIKGQGKPKRCQKDSGRFVRKVLNAGVAQSTQSESTPAPTYNWMNQPIRS